MDKEKEIKEMTNKIDDFCSCIDGECDTSCSKCLSNFLVNAGYGNVKQAVKEFAEYAKQVIIKQFSDTEMEKIKTVGALQLLYNKIEELYGADDKE